MTASTYTRWDITDLGNGRAHLRYESNEGDDGVPETDITVLEWDTSLARAFETAGEKSHIGWYCQPIDVYLNGKRV
jgi:hypothetical protein